MVYDTQQQSVMQRSDRGQYTKRENRTCGLLILVAQWLWKVCLPVLENLLDSVLKGMHKEFGSYVERENKAPLPPAWVSIRGKKAYLDHVQPILHSSLVILLFSTQIATFSSEMSILTTPLIHWSIGLGFPMEQARKATLLGYQCGFHGCLIGDKWPMENYLLNFGRQIDFRPGII